MNLKTHCKQIFVIGVIVAIVGIILTRKANEIMDYISFGFLVFGAYWTGLAVGLDYKADNEARSKT